MINFLCSILNDLNAMDARSSVIINQCERTLKPCTVNITVFCSV